MYVEGSLSILIYTTKRHLKYYILLLYAANITIDTTWLGGI